MTFDYHIPTKILFGPGKLEDLSKEKLPGKKALLVITSGKSMKKNGYLERVEKLLGKNGVETVLFDKVLPNPILSHVHEGAELARKEGCDFVVGLGGGSSIDSAKSIAIMVNNPGDYWDYINGGTGKGQPMTEPVLPIVAITTTAGTGTEADPWTVITHEDRNEKIGFGCAETFPVLSVVDPELMVTIPPHLTAFQGFDAFFHAAEGYIATVATPISDAYALKSIENVSKSLAIAVKDGNNLEARTNVALSNTLSGMVESTSCTTSEHSIAHAMGAFHSNLPHGAALIMISLEYFKFFTDTCSERLSDMAAVMGGEKSAEGFLSSLVKMQKDCGVDNLKMSDYGITREEFPTIADNAIHTMGMLFDLDRKEVSRETVIAILEASYK